MKNGQGGRVCRPANTGLALTAILTASLVLAGCDDHSPVAAPTSTVAPGDSAASSSADLKPTAPSYKTDLDLSPDEKEAVEGALVALDGYVRSLNRAFSSGGAETNQLDKFATGDALQALNDDSKALKQRGQYMAGEFVLEDLAVNKILEKDTQISILSCVDNNAFAQVDKGESLPAKDPEPLTVEFIVGAEIDTWKVESQDLWSEHCES